MKNCDLDLGDSVQVEGPCTIYYSRRKSAKKITLSIAADRAVRISPSTQSPKLEKEECFSAADTTADVVNV